MVDVSYHCARGTEILAPFPEEARAGLQLNVEANSRCALASPLHLVPCMELTVGSLPVSSLLVPRLVRIDY